MGARLKAMLIWGVLLFIVNYIVLYILVVAQIIGPIGPVLFLPFNLITSIFFSYKGTLAFSKAGDKEKGNILKSGWNAAGVGWSILLVTSLLFGVAAYLFSGEFDFKAGGFLVGAIGGLMARNRLLGKKLLFGIG